MSFLEWLKQPWPWYVGGPLLGLIVPLLLLGGNKAFGISSSLRHICAATIPSGIPFFKYDWKKEIWNLFFVGGVVLGAFLVAQFFNNPVPVAMNPKLAADLQASGVKNLTGLVPVDLFSWDSLLSLKGIILIVVGG